MLVYCNAYVLDIPPTHPKRYPFAGGKQSSFGFATIHKQSSFDSSMYPPKTWNLKIDHMAYMKPYKWWDI